MNGSDLERSPGRPRQCSRAAERYRPLNGTPAEPIKTLGESSVSVKVMEPGETLSM